MIKPSLSSALIRRRARLGVRLGVVGLACLLTGGLGAVCSPQPGWSAFYQPAPLLAAHGESIPDQYVVVLKRGGDPTAVAGRHGIRPKYVYSTSLAGFASRLTSHQLAALRDDDAVSYVAPDQPVSLTNEGTPPAPPAGAAPGDGSASGPGSVQSPAPWNLDRIDQRTKRLNGKYRYTATGKGVTVYVLDTGLYPGHTDFGARAVAGFTAVADGNGTADCNGHGTHVTGTIGGTKYGVAKEVSLVVVRVLDCKGEGSFAGVIAGVDWVTYHHFGPSVANMSLNGQFHQPLNDAVANSIATGVTYTVSAGNHYADACGESPAATPAALAIAATDKEDTRPGWSNVGPCVDLFAPGVDIMSDWIGGVEASNIMSGTSMASPHVAGLAALYLQINPFATPATVQAVLTTTAVPGVVDPGASPDLLARKWSGTLAAGTNSYQPDGMYWYQRNAGYIQLWLLGSPETDPDLYLQHWNGTIWENVAKTAHSTLKEQISLAGSAGFYRMMVYAYSGTGSYDVWATHPA